MGELSWSRILRLSSMMLVLAAAALIAGQVVLVLGFPRGGTRATLEGLSEIANGVNGLLVLGAVLLALAVRQLPGVGGDVDGGTRRRLFVEAILGAIIVAAALYAVVDVLTIHIPSPAATGQALQIGLTTGHTASLRLAVILERGGGGVLGAWALWLATRSTNIAARAPVPIST